MHGTLDAMVEPDSPVTPHDRVALLRHGIVVVDTAVEDDELCVDVTGFGLGRVHDLVAAQLGDETIVEVVGELPRRLEPRRCMGHMEREPRRLQVRLELCGDEHVDEITVAEDSDCVVVLATVCASVTSESGDVCEVPCHVYLETPLAAREVVDGATGEPIPYKNVYAALARKSNT
jgi:hypothetical protein